MTRVHHFYHLYADGSYLRPLREHLLALENNLPQASVTVGVVGTPENRAKAMRRLHKTWTVHEWDTGWEQRTLEVLFDRLPFLDGPVLYAHSKGSANVCDVNDVWRQCMTKRLIANPQTALTLLEAGADTVGCHWLTPEAHPKNVKVPYYGGNYWWASRDHLLRLPPPSWETRYHAEAWLGTVRPERPMDLMPGWPGAGCAHH